VSERSRRAVAAAVVLVTVLGGAIGCSSSDPAPPAASSSTTTAAPPATAAPTTQDEAADEVIAGEALLTVDELPGGPWVEGDARSSSPGTGLDCDAMAEESEYFNEHAKGAPGAKAPEYTDATNETSVQLDVNIVADDEVATTVAGFFADERFAGCLEDRLLDGATAGSATITDAAVAPITIEPVGDSAVAWSVTFTITQGAEQTQVSGIIAFVQVGRGFANVSLIGMTPPTAADIEPILAAAAAELETALA
jgi:hypothetical protein